MKTKDEALKMAHKTFMQLNERTPRKEDGSGYFDKEINACKEALEQPAQDYGDWFPQPLKVDATSDLYAEGWNDCLNECWDAYERYRECPNDYVLICKRCGDDLGLEYVPDEQPTQEPVELEEALKHCDGKDCECYAYYQGECGCDADWTPEEVVKLRYQLNNIHPHQWQGNKDEK